MSDRIELVQPWQTIDAEPTYGCRIFSLSRRRSRSPRTGEIHDFHVIESPDWVNIIPLEFQSGVFAIAQAFSQLTFQHITLHRSRLAHTCIGFAIASPSRRIGSLKRAPFRICLGRIRK